MYVKVTCSFPLVNIFGYKVQCYANALMFPFHSTLVEEAISTMIIKTMNLHVLFHLAFIMTIFASFNI